jgi:hypothetical protein
LRNTALATLTPESLTGPKIEASNWYKIWPVFWADNQGVDSMAMRMSHSMAAVHSRQGKLLGPEFFTRV